jgi:2-polyprenyl-3-methyl-5-hydroxy-6-metoxy-1,4-benzoquinol methylase
MPTQSKATERQPVVAGEVPPQLRRWDHSSHEQFFDDYARKSQTEEALERFRGIRNTILRVMGHKFGGRVLEVADVGCGAGTQSMIWSEQGHSVHAIDINEPLVRLGRERAANAGCDIDFRVGSATDLPWPNESMDVCIALELIEHVADWRRCLDQFARIIRPGGVLLLTTTNLLSPRQEEFNLPFYSWYPPRLKNRFEQLALTTRPDLANFARYPAVNWFTFYRLQAYLGCRGFESMDRFDMIDVKGRSAPVRLLVSSVRSVSALRFIGQICTGGTRILAIKRWNPTADPRG